MKFCLTRILLCSGVSCALILGAAQGPGRGPGRAPRGPEAPPPGVYTNVSGTIVQFNYDRDAEVSGFLLSDKTLVQLPPRAAARFGTSLHAGDSVQVGGFGQASASGFQTLEARNIQDRTAGKNFSMPEPGADAPLSGSGRIRQLNYGPDGGVNGFLLDNGTLVSVPPFSSMNPTSVRVGATISYSGYGRNTVGGRTAVDAQTLTAGGQAITLAGPLSPPPPPRSPRTPAAPPNRSQAEPPPPPAPPNVP